MSYVTSAACLRAEVYNVSIPEDVDAAVRKCLLTITVKEFVPKAGVRIDVTDSEAAARSHEADSTGVQKLVEELLALKVCPLFIGSILILFFLSLF